MSLKPVNYISLSALSYIEFNSSMRNKTVEYLVNNKLIKEDNLSNPELSALKSSSNPLRSYILLDYTSTPSGFQAAAFQSPSGEIVFSFKGTDAGNGSEFSKDIANADEQIFTGSSKGLPAQFVDAENFVMPILRSNPDVKCSFTGHSLGGAIAQYMTYRTIYKSVTFNAPGIGEVIESATGDKIDYEFYKDIATNYANESDIVGNYRDYARIGGNILISSSVNPEVAADRDAYNRTIQLMIRKRNTYSYTNDEVRIMSEGIAAGKRLRDRGLFYNHSMSSLMDSDGKLMPVSSGKPLGDQFMIELVTGASIAYSGARDTILFIGNFIADSIWSSYSFLRAVFSGDLNNVFDLFKNASVAAKVDPLIFDLNGDGIRTTSLDDSTAYFDLDGDGFAEKVAWVGDGDGLLTLDRNGDGMVTNGQELFGDRTRLINGEYATSGFEALREFDDNNDGKIDTKDNVYSKLKMWQDINHDGLSQPEELKSLVDLGIVSIGLESTVTGAVDVMNNIQRRLSSFMKSDGSTAQVGEYLLNRDTVDSRDIFGESIVVPKDILLLPNMQGAGRVSSLHVSMAKDESGQLKAMVVDFVNANNAENRNRLFTEILYKWTGVDGLDPASRGGLIDARQLGVLEKFMGTDFVGNNGANPNSNAAPLLQKAYDKLVDRLYAMIASSSYLKKLIDKIDFKVDESGIEVDFLGVEKDIDKRIEEDSAAGINILGDFLRTIYGFGLNYKSNIDQFCNYFAAQSPELARIVYSSNKDAIVGDKNSQSLYGSSGSDVIYGDAGDDTLIGNTGNDTLIGGQGKDTLRGGYGDDTYIFNKGDGVDYIEEDRGDNDTIQFGEGITLKDLKFFRYDSSGRNLYITVGDNGDAISIKNYFNDGSYSRPTDTFKVEKLLFSDGTTIDAAYIYEQVRTITGSRDGNTLIGHDDQDNILHGLDGNDTIYGGTGNDLLYGDAGDDTLIGNTGNDTLIGGQGKDTLRGGYGDDTYIFNKGDGVDYIEEDRGDNDTIQFGEGITLKDLKFFRYDSSGRNLYITVGDNGDAISIKNYFNDGSYSRPTDTFKVEKLLFSDGTTIDAAYIYEQVRTITGSRDGNTLIGHDDQDNILHGLDGNDTIYGGTGNDLLYGDAGDDTLIGNTGNDTLIGGQGKDTLRGGYGDDTYIFNKGDGVDYIEEDRGDNDTIQFGEGITLKDLKFFRYDSSGRNLYITVGDNGDAISIKNYFNDGSYSRPTDTFKVEKLLFSDGTTIDAAYIYEQVRTITGSRDGNTLIGHDDQDNILHGLDGNDTIYGGTGNDLLYGDAGDDTLIGNTGNDTLIGGQGKDTLRGGYGDDTYIFNKGDGVDYIEEDRGDNDTIQFGEGITLKDLKFFRYDSSGRNLYITVGDNGDAISIKNYFNDGSYSRPTDTFKVEKLLFSDGTTIDAAYIYEQVRTITGSRDGNTLIGHDDQDNILHGLDGNDTIYGGTGNDLLYGDAGDDTLIGNTGNDTLIGGQGKDTLRGGYGDDTYIFNKGDGVDYIEEDRGDNDTIQFGEGITLKDLKFFRYDSSGRNLYITVGDNGDAISIKNYFNDGSYSRPTDTFKVEKLLFSDGTTIDAAYIYEQVRTITGSRDGNTLIGHDDQDNILHGLDGNDTIYGGTGNDLLYGDAGDDTLIGNTGNDTLIGGQGKDTLRGGYGDDTYIFNKGDGVDYIEEDRGDNDTIQFGEGITLKDLKFFRYDSSGRNLYITVGDNGDAISIKNYFNDGSYSRPTDTFKVEKLLFSDGTTIDAAYIYEQVRTITGSRDGNTLIGHDDQDNILHGLDGNDTIYGGTGNDLLYGDAGDDTLIGNTGNDTLIGGQGKDTLRGGYGDDTYIFNKGDGVDRIYDMNGLADEVRLKHKLQDVIFERRSDDLVVYMPGSLDSVVIDSWYRGDNYKIETFTSEDGKFITHTQIESLIQAMSAFQKDTGMTWQQALSSQPSQVESIVTQYWTAPTA